MKKTYTFYIFLVVKIKGAKYMKHLQTLIIQKRKLKHEQESRLRKIRPRLCPWAMVSDVRWHLPPFPKRPHFSTLLFKVILFICHIFRLLSSRNWPILFIFFCDVPKVYRSRNIIMYQGHCLVLWLHGYFSRFCNGATFLRNFHKDHCYLLNM